VTAPNAPMSETDLGALIDRLRHAPGGADELAALLPESLPIYRNRSAAEMGRLRGYLLAAFADTGVPQAALPFVLESLATGHVAVEVAGAAVGLRGLAAPTADILAALLRAVDNLAGADATISFEQCQPVWPYRRPTTALTEVVRTVGHFGSRAAAIRPQLELLARQRERFPGPVLKEIQDVLDRLAGCVPEPPAPGHSCCAGPALREQPPGDTTMHAVLEDQDARATSFGEFFRGRPSIVAFFYTRCDNPYKCSLTISKLAALQNRLAERGMAGAVRLAAITYDPDFDLPNRLRRYGADRGVRFGEDARFFRVTTGFQEIRQRFDLGVNYGPSTVNRHRSEVYLLNDEGGIAAAFTRQQWDVAAVLAAVENLAQTSSTGMDGPSGRIVTVWKSNSVSSV